MSSGAHSAAQTFGVLALLIGGARLGSHGATRLGLPAVVGELGAGIALGTAGRLTGAGAEPGAALRWVSELGVLLLMFELGLESSLDELRRTGWRAAMVATVGAVGAVSLGTLAGFVSGVTSGWKGYVFVGAALAATSVGITARVFRDLGQIRSAEAQLVLAAAVIDDILGLLALAALSAIAGQGGGGVGLVVLKALGFVALALGAGRLLVPRLFARASKLAGRGGLVMTAMVTCFAYAWAADALGLAPAIGAFFAGASIRPEHVAPFQARGEGSANEAIAPLTAVFVPVFFVLAGAQLDLSVLADGRAVLGALLLTLAAALGKLSSGLAARGGVPSPLAVGVGMMPLGEVSLIVISTGASAPGADGQPLLGRAAFGAALLTVLFTSLLPPLALMKLIQRKKRPALATPLPTPAPRPAPPSGPASNPQPTGRKEHG